MKRITVDEVLAAYKATGLKPLRGSAISSTHSCCALGALSQQLRGHRRDVYSWSYQEFGTEYSTGFTLGFDWGDDPSDITSQAFLDGRAAAAAVFAEAAQ